MVSAKPSELRRGDGQSRQRQPGSPIYGLVQEYAFHHTMDPCLSYMPRLIARCIYIYICIYSLFKVYSLATPCWALWAELAQGSRELPVLRLSIFQDGTLRTEARLWGRPEGLLQSGCRHKCRYRCRYRYRYRCRGGWG